MEITLEQLQQDREQVQQRIKQCEADLNANYGALQTLNLLIAQAQQSAPPPAPSKK